MRPGGIVLVTGASTGIGRRIVERLAREGCRVFAGVRKDCDLEALGMIANVKALRLDVTNPDHIADAVDTIANDGNALHGLVNNAGIASVGSIVEGNDQEFDLVMSTNLVGTHRVTKAFAPLIIRAGGRIVMMSSISGILAPANVSAYSMSKHAIEALADSLSLELESSDIRVSVIEPGDCNTEIGKNAAVRLGHVPWADRSSYGDPDEVATAVTHALFEKEPKRRYLVVSNAEEAEQTVRKLIRQLVQVNEGHGYTYGRQSLIDILDQELAGSRPRIGDIHAEG